MNRLGLPGDSRMRIELHVFHHFPQENAPSWVDKVIKRVEQAEIKIMAKIDDKIDELNGVLETIGTGVAGVAGDVAELGAEIASLKEQLANAGNLTPDQEARFDATIGKATAASDALKALDALNPATPPATPPVPTPQPDAA